MTQISPIIGRASETLSRPAALLDDDRSGAIGPAATVIARDGRDATLERDDRIVAARIAFGCIVLPEPGDRVLTSVADGMLWVTAVLERVSGAPMRLCAEGDVTIVSRRGDVALVAGRAIALDAAERVRVAAPEISLHAGVARFVLDELVQIGRRASLLVGKVRLAGEMIEMVADHVLTRARRSSRFVEESDQLRAGDIDHRADGTLQMRARTMLMTGDTVVRVDADQIHMG